MLKDLRTQNAIMLWAKLKAYYIRLKQKNTNLKRSSLCDGHNSLEPSVCLLPVSTPDIPSDCPIRLVNLHSKYGALGLCPGHVVPEL